MSLESAQEESRAGSKRAVESVRSAIEAALRSGLIPRGETILVAVSGGVDSTALLHSLASSREELGVGEVVAGHVDHGLRPDSSDDASAVAELCRSMELRFLLRRVKVDGPGGLQAAARRVRHLALEEMRVEVEATRILTAHTADDQAETLILRIARGTSTSGLAGMRKSSGTIVRPFLNIRRALLEEYCRAHQLPVREDPSNSNPRFMRVLVREEIIPYVETRLGPGFRSALCRLAEMSGEENDLLEEQARRLLDEARHPRGGLDTKRLETAHGALVRRALAREWRRASTHGSGQGATPPPMDNAHIEKIRGLLPLEVSRTVSLPGGMEAHLSCGCLCFAKRPFASLEPVTIRGPGTYRLPPSPLDIVAAQTEDRGKADADRMILPWPLQECVVVRGWRPGDRLEGGVPVSRILKKARVPRPYRPSTPVVLLGERLVWVPGIHRAVLSTTGPSLELRVISREATAGTEG